MKITMQPNKQLIEELKDLCREVELANTHRELQHQMEMLIQLLIDNEKGMV